MGCFVSGLFLLLLISTGHISGGKREISFLLVNPKFKTKIV